MGCWYDSSSEEEDDDDDSGSGRLVMSLRGRLLGMLSYRTVVTTCRLHYTITYMNVSAGVYAQRMESQREFDRLMEDCRQNEDRQNGNCKKKGIISATTFYD